jgi:hypothetical protein
MGDLERAGMTPLAMLSRAAEWPKGLKGAAAAGSRRLSPSNTGSESVSTETSLRSA